jgi:glycosyltransferase involved in cell wall biosynthesis
MESVLRADAIICISETTKQDVIGFYGVDSDKLYVIPLAPSDVFRKVNAEDNHSETQRPFILFVGRRNNYKNFITLLLAYIRWPERRNVDLVVVGDLWSKAECRILEKAGVESHVQLITNIDDHQLAILYNRATVFIFPSLYEGFGLPLLEAMACGCPVIASRIPSNVEVASDSAIYFEPEDGDALISALEQAITDGRSAWRVQQGLQHVKKYSWDNTAQQTLTVYRKLTR